MKPQSATDWDNLKSTIKETIGIDQIAQGNGIILKKSGKNLKGLCPFHKEKTASFTLSSYNASVFNQFRCFGCERSGDIFDFYQAINSCNFPTAIRDLAGIANLPLPVLHQAKYPAPRRENNSISYGEIPYSESAINQPIAAKKVIPTYIREEIPSHVPSSAVVLKVFSYGEKKEVRRWEYPDPQSAKGRGKVVRPYCNGKPSKGPDSWSIYGESEALGKQTIFAVEGENKVAALGQLGLHAIAWLGSDFTATKIEAGLTRLKESGVERVIYIPDNDEAGNKNADLIGQFSHILPIEILPMVRFWPECPRAGDVVDFFSAIPQTRQEFLKKVINAIELAPSKELKNNITPIELAPKLSVVPERKKLSKHQIALRILESNIQYSQKILQASESGISVQEFEKFASLYQEEESRKEEGMRLSSELSEVLKNDKDLDISRYIYGDKGKLATELKSLCHRATTPQANAFLTLLSASAPLLGGGTKIVISPGADYIQPCIFWTVIVGFSGTNKSSVPKTILRPLIEMEGEEIQAYNEAFKAYEEATQKGERAEKPLYPKLISSDITIPTLEDNLNKNGGHLTLWIEELSKLFMDRSSPHRGGGEKQSELRLFSGDPIVSDRMERRNFCANPSVSLTGTLQPALLEKISKGFDDIHDGYWARFLFSSLSCGDRIVDLKNDQKTTLVPKLLKQLYSQCRASERKFYYLSEEAKPIFEKYNQKIVALVKAEQNQALALVYPKVESYMARFALWIHVINAILAGNLNPPDEISGNEMELAAELADFFLGQAKIVYGTSDTSNGLVGHAIKIHQYLSRREHGSTANSIRSNTSLRSLLKSQDIRHLCEEMCNSGHLRKEGEGSATKYFAIPSQHTPEIQQIETPKEKDIEYSDNQPKREEIPERIQDGHEETDIIATDMSEITPVFIGDIVRDCSFIIHDNNNALTGEVIAITRQPITGKWKYDNNDEEEQMKIVVRWENGEIAHLDKMFIYKPEKPE